MGLTLDQLANAVAAAGQIAGSPPTDPEGDESSRGMRHDVIFLGARTV
jgi:hypothetical protein